jgi:DNA-binding NtrC family response regulator
MHNHVFREDLYYRLKVVPIDMPPLRKRKDDIIPLAQFFLAKSCEKHRKLPMTLSAAAEEALLNHPWPGNVRELENLISRTVVLSSRTVINPGDLGLIVEQIPRDVNLKLAKRTIEMEFLRKALGRNHGVVSRAARELGISRVNLYELMEKYNLRLQEFKIFKKAKSQIKAREV